MLIDIILLTTIALFGLWIINKHYDNAYDIEELQKAIKLTKCKVCKGTKVTFYNFTGNAKYKDDDEFLNPEVREEPCPECQQYDIKKMQNDIIILRQNCINIDAKYKIKDKWCVDTIEEITQLQSKMIREVI
jgi:hypothetical protein